MLLATLVLALAQDATPMVLVGEVNSHTAVLDARDLPASGAHLRVYHVLRGKRGAALVWQGRLTPDPDHDGIARVLLTGLARHARHTWEVHGPEIEPLRGEFHTHPGSKRDALNFVVTNCMNHHYFMHGGQGRKPYQGDDKELGYPGLAAIDALDPEFVVFAGDNVYYDRPANDPARDAATMRAHWRQLFALPRMRELMRTTPSYWLKDDHDHRYNDSDRTGNKQPGHDLGRAMFREQVPIVALDDDDSPTWRTVRVSQDLQIWMTEGRDHRSPNRMQPGPDKTLWGVEQRNWLKQSLLTSGATFKILISPTPMVGPDDGYKADNHTNEKGFRAEGEAFHAWLAEHQLNDRGFLIICGDRHWQYHSIHPQGTHEFAVGALLDSNARMGRKPGDPKSTDPDSLVQQPYSSKKPSGGFLEVQLEVNPAPRLELVFRDEQGVELHRVVRQADPQDGR